MSKGLPTLSYDQTLSLKFKPLPNHLKYTFLGEKETLPMIVNVVLDEEKLDKLL